MWKQTGCVSTWDCAILSIRTDCSPLLVFLLKERPEIYARGARFHKPRPWEANLGISQFLCSLDRIVSKCNKVPAHTEFILSIIE